jgi:predicted acyl esterase
MTITRRLAWATTVAIILAGSFLPAQQGTLTPAEQQRRKDLEAKLQDIAVVERRVMIPMKDGVRLVTDIYRPKSASNSRGTSVEKYPIVFVKTPYNFNFWDVRNGVPADMSRIIEAIEKGYAYVGQNERGHFFSEGNYDILGAPITDGYETIDYLTKQPWSNGKLGTTGCSSTAEWQPAVASLGHPGFAAMNVQGFGAGVGKVGPYWEQGNWYRGGAMQMLFITWIYGEQNQVRPMFPKDTPREDLIAAGRMFDLAPRMPPVDWDKALCICQLRTSSRASRVRGHLSPIACRSRPAAQCSSASPRRTRGARAACGTTTWRSTCPASGSCRGTTCRLVRTSRCSITCAAARRRR